jgi:hypothetical protein
MTPGRLASEIYQKSFRNQEWKSLVVSTFGHLRYPKQKEGRMTKSGIIGAAVLSLVLAGPAMAASDGGYRLHRPHHEHYRRVIHRMPAQDFDHFDFYPSGRSSPYVDDYQGPVDDDNVWMPPTANGG